MGVTILAIETSTHACSVALEYGGEVISRHEVAARRHGELLLPWVDALLKEAGITVADLDAIAVSRGPGAFTGVRIGVAAAQGLAMAYNLPAVAVSSLAVCAQGAYRLTGAEKQLVAFDARMGELYWAEVLVEAAGQLRLLHESVIAPEAIQLPTSKDWLAVSDGWASYPALQARAEGILLADQQAVGLLPNAIDLLVLAQTAFAAGQGVSASAIQPVYLRNNVAAKPKAAAL